MKLLILLALVLLAPFINIHAQTILYVDSSANGLNNGSSWIDAYKHLDSAIKFSHQNGIAAEIRLAKGTYFPTKKKYITGMEMVTTDSKDVTFHLPEGTTLNGGYPSGGGIRNPLTNPTILSGQLNATIKCYHVVYQDGSLIPTTIDGVTITGGYCPTGSFTWFPQGGGYYCEGFVEANFNQVYFKSNYAWLGGAVYFLEGGITFTECEFIGNTATQSVGGVFADHGSIILKACVFKDNTHGCCRVDYDYSVQASNTLFINNSSFEGGALYAAMSDYIYLRNCTFYGNTASSHGGAIFSPEPGILQIYNCVFANNMVNGVSEDVYYSPSFGYQVTIDARYSSFQNPSSAYPTGMFWTSGVPTLFFNQNPQFADTSNIKGLDNIYGTSDDGLKLTGSSICINTGHNGYIDANYAYDITGSARIQGTVDRGAYEQDCQVYTYSTSTAVACGTYNWPVTGMNYTTSGTYSGQQACTIHTLNLTINPIPQIIFNTPFTLCAGSSATITASGGNSYTWVPGNLNTATVTLSPTVTTNYTISTTSSAGCTSSVLKTLTVNQLPSVQTSASATSVCPGSIVTITASSTSGTNTYTWQPGNFSGNPLTAYPNIATTYTVTGTSVATGCTKTTTRLISMKSVPNITTSATPIVVCSGASSTITASGGAAYIWQPGGNTTAAITVNPIITSVYTVTGTSATSGCTKSATRTITVNCGNSFNLTCFIEGYYLGNSLMQPVLNNQGLSNTTTQADSLTVELHNSVAPYNTLYSIKVVLLTNGTYSGYFPTSTSGNYYYIVLKHRNALETWSKNPVLFSSSTSYNFSNQASKAFGDNMKLLSSGVYGLFSGDVNSDGSIDVFDYLLLEPEITNGSAGYLPMDFNGDGGVDIFDYLLLESNMTLGVGSMSP